MTLEQPGTIATGPDVLVRTDRRAGLVTLNRAANDNRLNLAMRATLAQALQRHEKDREIYASVLDAAAVPFCLGDAPLPSDGGQLRAALSMAAESVWRIDRHGKPFVTLIDGSVADGGMGLFAHGTHSVAAEAASFALPECAQGHFPISGMSLKLSGMPQQLGLYLALSGRPIDRSMAYRAGLVTHCIDAAQFAAIREHLAEADPLDAILDGMHRDPPPSPLARHLSTIERCFGASAPEGIIAALHSETGESAAWAVELAGELEVRSQAVLAVTHRLLTVVRPQTLRDALTLEFRLAMNRLGGTQPDAQLAAPEGGDLLLPSDPQPPSIS